MSSARHPREHHEHNIAADKVPHRSADGLGPAQAPEDAPVGRGGASAAALRAAEARCETCDTVRLGRAD